MKSIFLRFSRCDNSKINISVQEISDFSGILTEKGTINNKYSVFVEHTLRFEVCRKEQD